MTASEPLRVLSVGNVYPPHLLGGYEVIWQGVMRELRGQGHVARVLVTDLRRPEAGADAAEDPEVYRELDWYWRDHGWPQLSLRGRLALERHNAAVLDRHLRELRPDVITFWALGGLSIGLVERVRRGSIPALFFVLDPWPVYGPERDQWTATWSRAPGVLLRPWVERLTGLPAQERLARTGRWLFCSQAMRRTVLEAGLRPRDQTVLSPGVAQAFLDARPEPSPPPWRWRLLYTGRVVEQKGVTTAVEALSHLPRQATLRIVGEGDEDYRRELEALTARLSLADRVSFEAPRRHADMVGLYREADLVVFPVTWPEPWGLVPLEAMAVGRPVVATGRGGSGDFLRDRENCLLFAAGDPAALAQRVSAIAEDPGLRAALRAAGRATAEAHSEHEFNRRAVEEIERAAGLTAG
jgi:glycosyltransferase involved in cell wall biosynthesis